MKNNIKEKEIGIVVLNYKNFRETIECVKGILLQKDVSFYIVIVDNGSSNESFDELFAQFENNDKIHIIKSDINLGYAKGNNLGINYLRNKGIENIFIANSDLLFKSPYVLKQIIEAYEPGIGLINPIICNPDGQIDQRVSYKKKLLYLRMLKKFLEWYFEKTISFSKSSHNDSKVEYVKEITGTQTDRYIVAGSGFMLTGDFFAEYRGLYPGTFLYYEEWATIILLHKASLKTKVAETDPIIHIGGASTPKNVRTMTKERRKICFNSWKAIFLLAIGHQNKKR